MLRTILGAEPGVSGDLIPKRDVKRRSGEAKQKKVSPTSRRVSNCSQSPDPVGRTPIAQHLYSPRPRLGGGSSATARVRAEASSDPSAYQLEARLTLRPEMRCR